jgi:hypothetical protein
MPPKTTLNTYRDLVGVFADFLIVAIHTILYERDIYPRASFLSARKYDFPVRQNRHPKVCKWIFDAVSAVETELLKVVGFYYLIFPDGVFPWFFISIKNLERKKKQTFKVLFMPISHFSAEYATKSI